MRRGLTLLLATIAAASPAMALKSASRRSVGLKGTATLALIKQTGSPPAAGTQETAGPLGLSATGAHAKSLGFGAGAVVAHAKFHPGAFSVSAVLYQPRGTVRLRANGTVSVSGNKVTFQGHGPITGGTGRYQHAGGTLSFTGSGPVGATTDHYKITAHLTLPLG